MRNNHLIIDTDRHVVEPADLWRNYMPEEYREQAPYTDPEGGYTEFAGQSIPERGWTSNRNLHMHTAARFADFQATGYDTAAQLGAMDTESIDYAVLFPTMGLLVPGVVNVDPKVITMAAAAYNTWLRDFCSEGEGRLFGTGMLDLRDVEGACREANRCIEELGFVGLFLRPNVVEGLPLYHEKYDRLWSTIEDLNVPVCFHEGAKVLVPQVGPPQLGNRWAFWHCCTHPHEQQIAMVSMILGGVLERHPALRCGFLECGAGWLPFWMWRMDEHTESRAWNYQLAEPSTPLPLRPSEYVQRQCFVSIETEEHVGVQTVRALGGKNVLWASDFPHIDSVYPGAVETFYGIGGITDDDRRAILSENPLDFFGDRLASVLKQPTGGL